MNTSEIRKLFLDYFKSQGHTIVPSSSLVPLDDPSLLFTSAGMVQFKKIFLGQEIADYKRAASCQRCLRAGGKHNDLENVGFTSRHHTFFEMLGNFSFGDYFKREAIFYAWDFITNHLKIPAEKLWITVYKDDLDAADIWLKDIKIDPTRFSKCDEEENFWSMGDTGPCGPCTEIYYDHGAAFHGSPPGMGDTNERYVEIYNLVFMQYNRAINGELHPLPKPCVDTGMGLERVAAIMQSVHNNYHIDIFDKLIKYIGKLLNIIDLNNTSLRVIADHVRTCCFLVIDGVMPSNEGRGYVLRRIMRRAIRHGYKLGRDQPFFYLLVKSMAAKDVMGQDFPALIENQSKIEKIFLTEELQFAKTLEHGIKLLQQEILNTNNNIISGEIVFKLYDTYGFPVDLTMDVVREHNMDLDMHGFDKCMLEQKNRARKLTKFKDVGVELEGLVATQFIYDQNTIESKVLQIYAAENNQPVDRLLPGTQGKIILAVTPFYAESGGQVGDTGVLLNNDGVKFIVSDTQKLGKTNIHIGQLAAGELVVGEMVTATIDLDRREKIRLNHSATHLLHAALRAVLGSHIKQKGSVVDDKRLRFDFDHFQAVTPEQIVAVELLVNEKIRHNWQTNTEIMSVSEAVNKGAIALFTEKYQDKVRVLNIANDFSIELCGGTHVARTGDIGCFKIMTEEAIASGTRRIEAITGEEVIKYISSSQHVISNILKLLKIPSQDTINQHINKILQRSKELEKNLELIEKKNILIQIDHLKLKTEIVGDIKILVSSVNMDPKYLKLAIDNLKQSLVTAVIILGCEYNSKITLIAGVTKNLIHNDELDNNKISALALIKEMAVLIDGKGGGRADLSEASGTNVKNLSKALAMGHTKIMECISNP